MSGPWFLGKEGMGEKIGGKRGKNDLVCIYNTLWKGEAFSKIFSENKKFDKFC